MNGGFAKHNTTSLTATQGGGKSSSELVLHYKWLEVRKKHVILQQEVTKRV